MGEEVSEQVIRVAEHLWREFLQHGEGLTVIEGMVTIATFSRVVLQAAEQRFREVGRDDLAQETLDKFVEILTSDLQ